MSCVQATPFWCFLGDSLFGVCFFKPPPNFVLAKRFRGTRQRRVCLTQVPGLDATSVRLVPEGSNLSCAQIADYFDRLIIGSQKLGARISLFWWA